MQALLCPVHTVLQRLQLRLTQLLGFIGLYEGVHMERQCHLRMGSMHINIGRSKVGDTRFNFYHFHAVFCKKICPKNWFSPQTQGLTPSVWEILDLPLINETVHTRNSFVAVAVAPCEWTFRYLLVIFGAARTERHADAATLVPRVGHSSPRFTAQNTAVGIVDLSVRLGESREKA